MKRLLLLLALLLIGRGAFAQTTITVPALPASVTVAWTAPVTTIPISSYNVYDGVTVASTVPGTVLTSTFSLTTAGTHTLTATALNGTAESPHSNSAVAIVVVSLTAPPSPTAFVILSNSGPTCSTTSPLGTTAITITDNGCHVWTLSGTQTIRDGVAADSGAGSTYLYVTSGVYVLGTDSNWYHAIVTASGTVTWVNSGATKPTS